MHRFILLSAVIVIIASCGESKPPATTEAPPAAPASPAAAPATAEPAAPVAEPGPPAAASVPAPVEQPKNLAARKLDPEKIKRGQATYTKNCASCHGPNGEATPGWRIPAADGRYPPPPLDGSAHAWHHSTETLETMIRVGSPGAGMPAWDGKLTKQEIDDVIVWIKSLWPDEVYDIWLKEIESKPEPKRG
ncbi:cytochrome c [Nitrosospira sp. Nsp11]|uniref:c-type cytochrome n=1 Tax=Nitrosospira sp. Nsp11 TaxID=1855338 RepID=UPI0009F9BF40|nr:cytochrome c [Nitrosospira sp. Nsp11]